MPSRADAEKDRVLTVSHLRTVFESDYGKAVSVDDVSFVLGAGETLAIVGESGSGKSVTALSIMSLLGKNGAIEQGVIRLGDTDLASLGDKEAAGIRGNRISMIFQEPMTSLNPVFTVGYQLIEAIRLHLLPDKREARTYAIEMLRKVKLPQPERIMDEYPFALSGGMRQRVMIAMALACKPEVLIADEPTTALDVTVQAQIISLMQELCAETGTAIILITHDLGVVAEMADRVAVMYAGQIVEVTDVFTLFENPQHPYTQGLLGSIARLEDEDASRLVPIPGTVPSRYQQLPGCRFYDRCPLSREHCLTHLPPLLETGPGHEARCWYTEEAERKWRRERHA